MTRVLVTYASKHGSTEEIARAIAHELRERNLDVDCVDVGDASLGVFDAVILGSAVYMGRWRSEARHFLKKHREALSTIPFWIFSSGPVGEKADDEIEENSNWLEPHRVLELAESAGMRGHIVFGGRLPTDPHGFVENSMVRSTPEEFRDSRDWDAIRRWADEVAEQLQPAHA
jgi:menaquinone-dependent protoporphyrinogen oxidase